MYQARYICNGLVKFSTIVYARAHAPVCEIFNRLVKYPTIENVGNFDFIML